MLTLYPFQVDIITKAREALKTNKHIFIMLPTGGGKTICFVHMTSKAFSRKFRTWIIVPRDELLRQASNHLKKYNLDHGVINASTCESEHLIHIVSKNTLERRWDKIINYPDLIIIDEGHLNYKFQITLRDRIPGKTRMIAFSATPERMSGEGLSDIYSHIIYGSSINNLIDQGYLTRIKYFSPPLEGIEKLHKKGDSVDSKELADLFKKKYVYGKAIEHYKIYAPSACMVFCRSVEASEETAQQFRHAGYNFRSIDGKMNYNQRKKILTALTDGSIQGICSCEILIYGIDIPRIEVIIMLRPTFSRTYFMQMIGRGLRPYPGKIECIILDHVNNVLKHGHPLEPYEWKFTGKEKRKAAALPAVPVSVCPKCTGVFPGTPLICPDCGYNLQEDRDRTEGRKPPREIAGILKEILPESTPEQAVKTLTDRVVELQAMSKGSRHKALMSLLYRQGVTMEIKAIAEACGYAKGWAYAVYRRIGR